MTAPVTILQEHLDSLPPGHAERIGLIRAMEVLQHYSGTTRVEYRATWTSRLGRHEIVADTVESVRRQLEGVTYEKPDLQFQQRTITISNWAEV